MLRFMSLAALAAGFAFLAAPAFAGPTVATPEPASLSLLAVGIGGVALAKFRRRK